MTRDQESQRDTVILCLLFAFAGALMAITVLRAASAPPTIRASQAQQDAEFKKAIIATQPPYITEQENDD